MRELDRPGRAAGFTLIEMLVGVFIGSIVLMGVLGLFDSANRITRSQTNVTDMQQSLRAAQYDAVRLIRMAGRGPLPLRSAGRQIPTGVALEVVNNVPPLTTIGVTDGTGPAVVPGTDILIIRGVFNSSLYQVNYADPSTFSRDATSGSVIVSSTSPTGVPHELGPIMNAICSDDTTSEALLLVSPLDDSVYAVAELDASGSRAGTDCSAGASGTASLEIKFLLSGGTYTAEYGALSAGGSVPAALTSVAFVGLLEEYRFYIREIFAIEGDRTSDLSPRFSKARVHPGTDAPYNADEASWTGDIADNIFDLQVALGIDGNDDGAILDLDSDADEWLFNDPGDRPADPQWNLVQPATSPARNSRLYNIRLTTLARTDRRDKGYQAPLLTAVEDHLYLAGPSSRFNQMWERTFRRRTLQTVVDMRNVS
jgi:prepilin-type N-terminal cleavage/methylation domain-containing protein